MSESVNIGRTIARERRRAGVTQEALAAHLGVSKAAVSKWELGQSFPDVSLLPRLAAYFSLTLDELFDWHDELTSEESAALYAEVYALGEKDLASAHKRLRALASEHYSDANLMLMLASLLTVWAGGMATPFASAGEKDGALEALARAIEAVTLEHQDATDSPLWDCMADRLDPACAGEAWAEHKARQADEARLLIRQGLAERTSSPEWQRIVSEDPRYRDILAKAPR